MSTDKDYLYALRLQDELNGIDDELRAVSSPKKRKRDENDLNATKNIVHPEWETIDPTPDIHTLFGAFDSKFFQNKLKCVVLEWSKKMYSCAGICYQRRNAMGMAITIRLSQPLLTLRPRRDLIETMLHEMIHAYLFVKNIREGNGGHGPNFKKMMTDINKVAGTNITVYHTFHDEVAVYKTHIWRCNGICQHRKPFCGWVKRTRILAPGPNDLWWAKHSETCGGTFQKVSEPEPKVKGKQSKKAKIENKQTITDMWTGAKKVSNTPQNSFKGAGAGAGGYTKMNGGGTLVLKPTTQNRMATVTSIDLTGGTSLSSTKRTAAGGNLNNVVGFRDLNDAGSSTGEKTVQPSGRGVVLGSQNTGTQLNSAPPTDVIRNIWANKFPQPTTSAGSAVKNNENNTIEIKTPSKNKVIEATSAWEEIDDDILIHEVHNPVIEIGDESDNDDNSNEAADVKPNLSILHKTIREELLDDLGESDDVIEMIDDEFNDAFILDESLELLTDASVVDDIFGMDDLLAKYNELNDVVMKFPENKGNPDKEIISCPLCQDSLMREELTEHLEGCAGVTVKIESRKPKHGGKKNPLPFYKNQATTSKSNDKKQDDSMDRQILREAGYSEEVIKGLYNETEEAKKYNQRIMDEMAKERRQRPTNPTPNVTETISIGSPDREQRNSTQRERYPCPICKGMVYADIINEHLDACNALAVLEEEAQKNVPAREEAPCPVCAAMVFVDEINQHLDTCIGGDDD